MRHTCFAAIPVVLGVVVGFSGHRADAGSIVLSTVVRDFTPQTHPDFERYLGDDRGIVATTLGVDNKPVYAPGSNPSITSAARFDQFYNDTAGVNIAIPSSITLNETAPGSGIYRYSNNSYFPIDGQGFGNYGATGHNFHFTTEIHTLFTYQAGQSFSFTGDDDVWVFINKSLVIDLGGVHGVESATVLLDSLGLTTGNSYQLDVFHAERHTSQSNFTMETSIVLESAAVPEPSTIAAASIGAIGLAFVRRRRSK